VVTVTFCTVIFVAFPLRHRSEIRAAANEFDVCPALVASIIRAESNFRHDAVSHKGAIGLMQIMPSTAEFIAKKLEIESYDLRNPRDNIRMGTFYIRYLLNRFGDTRTAIMAYNAGEGNVKRWLGDDVRLVTTPFAETNAYVERVFNAKGFYRFRI